MSTSFSQEGCATRKQSVLQPILTKTSLLLLAASTALAADIVTEVSPSPHVVATVNFGDGRTYQVQELTLYTNYLVVFDGTTNLFKTVQGPTLTNWCDRIYVRTDRPTEPGGTPPLPPPLPIQPHTPK